MIWGQHLILDIGGADRRAIADAGTIRAFCDELVGAIDMTAFGEPLIAHFAAHNPAAAGYSLVQLIETSSITAHFAETSGDIYLDIFSCKAFSDETAIAVCRKYFDPESIDRISLMRGVGRTRITSSAA